MSPCYTTFCSIILVRRMQSSRFRYHGTKIVDYSIRAVFVLMPFVFVLFWLSVSGGLGTEPPEHGEQIFGILFFVAVAPAYCAVRLLDLIGVSSGFVGWIVSFIIVPTFWGAVTYALVQLSRRFGGMARQRLTSRWSERRPALFPPAE